MMAGTRLQNYVKKFIYLFTCAMYIYLCFATFLNHFSSVKFLKPNLYYCYTVWTITELSFDRINTVAVYMTAVQNIKWHGNFNLLFLLHLFSHNNIRSSIVC